MPAVRMGRMEAVELSECTLHLVEYAANRGLARIPQMPRIKGSALRCLPFFVVNGEFISFHVFSQKSRDREIARLATVRRAVSGWRLAVSGQKSRDREIAPTEERLVVGGQWSEESRSGDRSYRR